MKKYIHTYSFCNASKREIEITLVANPDTVSITIKKEDASDHACVIKGNGHKIENQDEYRIRSQFQSVTLKFNGKYWEVQ